MPPLVTGVSPKEGPPGTRVIIRGENLGASEQDVVCVMIGAWDATLSLIWHSAQKLSALSGPPVGPCPVIVTTRGGATGTCTVQFVGVEQMVGHLKASAVWLDKFDGERDEILQELVSTHGLGQEDVLGISMEDYESRFPDEQLEQMFPGKSGNLFSESFDPCWFLLENHQQSGYDDLRAGMNFLRRKVNADHESQLTFLRDNVSLVLEQLDALAAMHRLFTRDGATNSSSPSSSGRGQDPMVAMERALVSGKCEADKLFAEVVSRKQRADRTRCTLAVLQRYRLLFQLPAAINRNVQRGHYGHIVGDYAKARGLFGDSSVPVFRRVMTIVEAKVARLRDSLRSRLLELSDSYDEQRQLVAYLVELGASDDVAWQCVSAESTSLATTLRACRDRHIPPPRATATDHNTTDGDDSGGGEAVARFLASVCQCVVARLPALLKLGGSYLRGELHCQPADVQRRRAELRRMVRAAIELWSQLVRGALLPHTIDCAELAWPTAHAPRHPAPLSVCVRHVHSACVSLSSHSSTGAAGASTFGLDADSLDELSQLMFDLRKYSLMLMFSGAMEQVRKLPERSAWQLELRLEHGLGHTRLLSQFGRLVSQLAHQVHSAILTEPVAHETALMRDETVRKDTVVLVYNLVATFAQFLERLGFEETVSDDEDDRDTGGALEQSESVDERRPVGDDAVGALSIDRRLLLVLSTCRVLRLHRLPPIASTFVEAGFSGDQVQRGVDKVGAVLHELEQKLFEAYIEEKLDLILGVIEVSMYDDQYDWGDVTGAPAHISHYVHELLVNCIRVHAEVYQVAPLLLQPVLCRLVDGVAEELARLFAAVARMSTAGCQQAVVDISALRRFVRLYTSTAAEARFHATQTALLQRCHNNNSSDGGSGSTEDLARRIIEELQSSMGLYMACFSKLPSLDDFA